MTGRPRPGWPRSPTRSCWSPRAEHYVVSSVFENVDPHFATSVDPRITLERDDNGVGATLRSTHFHHKAMMVPRCEVSLGLGERHPTFLVTWALPLWASPYPAGWCALLMIFWGCWARLASSHPEAFALQAPLGAEPCSTRARSLVVALRCRGQKCACDRTSAPVPHLLGERQSPRP